MVAKKYCKLKAFKKKSTTSNTNKFLFNRSYIVEKKDKNSDKWERVQDFCAGTSCTIPKLKEGHEYDFRVIAENQNGESEPLQTEHGTLAKNPFGNKK